MFSMTYLQYKNLYNLDQFLSYNSKLIIKIKISDDTTWNFCNLRITNPKLYWFYDHNSSLEQFIRL